MAHQDVGSGVADDPVGPLLPARRTCRHLGVDAVQPGVEAVEMVKPGRRVDERGGLVDYLAIPHLHQADRTRRAAVGVGGLEVNCREIKSHYDNGLIGWMVLRFTNSAGSSARFSPLRPQGM